MRAGGKSATRVFGALLSPEYPSRGYRKESCVPSPCFPRPSPLVPHSSFLGQRSGNPKAQVAVVSAYVLVAVRCAHVVLLVFEPRAAAICPLRAIAFQVGGAIERRAAPL